MESQEYIPKLPDFEHQTEYFLRTRDLRSHACYWEQGLGKSKAHIDTACYLYDKGRIDAVLIVASNGVHRNWITDELPTHLPDRYLDNFHGKFFDSPRSGNKGHQQEMKYLINHKGFTWFAISYEGYMTKRGRKATRDFLMKHECLFILDEADKIKTPGAKRTLALVAEGKYANYKRTLTGTPLPLSPFDSYSQMRFLSANFWKKFPDLGISDAESFRAYFGVYQKQDFKNAKGGAVELLVDYRNLDRLKEIVDSVSSRLLKDEALPGLPAKLYSKIYFELTPEQKRLYKELKDEFVAEIRQGQGDNATARIPIVRLVRFAQIASGYLPSDNDSELIPIDGPNPRMDALMAECLATPHPAIIWAKYTHDIDMICERLSNEGVVRYDGQVSDDERAAGKDRFQNGGAKWFVGNPAAGSDGITLTAAKTVIYYNNSFNLRHRLQSEDRAHRIGQEGVLDPETGGNAVLYKDLCGIGSIDQAIITNLRKKKQLSDFILGDTALEWI